MVKKQKYQSKKYFEWKEFSLQFLSLSQLACEKLEDEVSREDKDNSSFLYVAIIYNVKHAIEICIKTYIRYLDEEISFGGNLGHDTRVLFAYLNKKNDIKKISNVIFKLNNNEEHLFVKSHIVNFKQMINQTEKIILKYYDLKKLNSKINLSLETALDYNNTFFKYPENNIDCSFDYQRLLAGISIDDIFEIKDDIYILQNNLFILGEILYYYKK